MIADAVDFIREEVRRYLGAADAQVSAGTPRTLAQHGKRSGAFISVVNIHEDTALVNRTASESRGLAPQGAEPHIIIDVLIAFEFQTYATSLAELSKTIELFQRKPVFSAATQTAPDVIPLPPTVEKIVVELVNMTFDDLHHLWGMLGSAYLPSVLYRMRLVKAPAVS